MRLVFLYNIKNDTYCFNTLIMKKLLFFAFIIVSLAFVKRDAAAIETSVIITPESALSVRGTTNINDFTCRFDVNQLKNPIQVLFEKEGDKFIFKKTALVLENSCFDCGGKGINSDFQKILKTDEHPKIFIFLKELKTNVVSGSKVLAHVDIEIAGVAKAYKIPVTINGINNMVVSGNVNISLKHFKMEPPKKLFGLIEVNDNIEIDFQLEVKEYQP